MIKQVITVYTFAIDIQVCRKAKYSKNIIILTQTIYMFYIMVSKI